MSLLKKKKQGKEEKVKTKSKKGESESGGKQRKKPVRRSSIDKVNQKFARFGKSSINFDKAVYRVRITDTQAVVTLQGQLLARDSAGIVVRHKKGRGSILRVSRIPNKDIVSIQGSLGEGCIAIVRRSQLVAEFNGTVEVSKSGKTATVTDKNTEDTTTVYLEDSRFDVEIFTEEGGKSSRKNKEGKEGKEGKKGKKVQEETGDDDFDD